MSDFERCLETSLELELELDLGCDDDDDDVRRERDGKERVLGKRENFDLRDWSCKSRRKRSVLRTSRFRDWRRRDGFEEEEEERWVRRRMCGRVEEEEGTEVTCCC